MSLDNPVPDPKFTTRMEGTATSAFPIKTSLDELSTWLRHNNWRGDLRISYAGNGGISSVTFIERITITEDAYRHGFEPRNGSTNGTH